MAAVDIPLISRVRRRLGGLARRAGGRRTPPPVARPRARPRGPKPAVSRETTHYGHVVDQLVESLRRNQRRHGVDADYDLVREHFDHYHYLLQAPELAQRSGIDPIRHFLRAGAQARFSPEINFSMKKYLQRYPSKKDSPERSPYLEWLKRGKDAGEIADPADGIEPIASLLGLEPREVVDHVTRLRSDTMRRLRTGTLGEMFAKAIEIEPLIGEAWSETAVRVNQLPLRNESVARAIAAIHGCHQDAGFRRAQVVVTTGEGQGACDRFARDLAGALAGTVDPAEIVVVHTEGSPSPGRFAPGVREVDFASRVAGVAQGVREQALVSLVRSFCARAVVNAGSELFYGALAPFGKALASSERIFLCFAPDQQTPLGTWDGPALRWFYPTFDYVAGIITETPELRDSLVEHYQLGEAEQAKVHVFAATTTPGVLVPGGASEREGLLPGDLVADSAPPGDRGVKAEGAR